MNIAFLPDLIALAMLVTILTLLHRRHPQQEAKAWLLGLFFTLLEALAHTFYAPAGMPTEALHVIVLDCYLVSGLIFLWAASGSQLSQRGRLLDLVLNAAPLLLLNTFYGMHLQQVQLYVAITVAGALIGGATALLLRRQPLHAVLMVAAWVALGLLASRGCLRQCVYWSLCALYALAALNLRDRLPTRSLGKLTLMTGFVIWALCLLIHPWIVTYRDYADVASHVWNMQKGLISLGLLLLLLEQQVTENHWLAQHDELTGLPNRRSFERSLATALVSARKDRSAIALVLLDLNGFKYINDSLGHDAGDHLLSAVGKNLSGQSSRDNVAARLGGDEFVVLASLCKGGTPLSQLMAGLKAAVEEPIPFDERWLTVKASFGYAVFPDDALEADQLLRVADQRMYAMKRKLAAPAPTLVTRQTEQVTVTFPGPWQSPRETQVRVDTAI